MEETKAKSPISYFVGFAVINLHGRRRLARYFATNGEPDKLIDMFVKKVICYGNKKGKVRYNVTDFSTGSFYERVVEIRGFEPDNIHRNGQI